MGEPLILTGPHWKFALRVYGQEGVPEACLVMQDRHGLDVNILLVSLFAQLELGAAIDGATLRQADAAIRDWRENVVQPLRAVRRWLKTAPGRSDETEALRDMVKAAELRGEQIEEAMLENWYGANSEREKGADPTEADLLRTLHLALETLGEGEADPQSEAAMARIAAAALAAER